MELGTAGAVGIGRRGGVLAILVVLLVTVVAAQVESSKDVPYQQPTTRAYDAGPCLELEVKALHAATDLSQSLEEQKKFLNAAEAYGRLDALEQLC